jgi:hypothetical protein
VYDIASGPTFAEFGVIWYSRARVKQHRRTRQEESFARRAYSSQNTADGSRDRPEPGSRHPQAAHFISAAKGLADWQTRFFRAGHTHAGVLLVLTLVDLLYLPRADFSDRFEWIPAPC